MADFQSETVTVRIETDPDPEEVAELYRAAGWLSDGDTADSIRRSLRGSYAFCAARTADGTLAGMMRALSDGVSDAYLLDLVVLPAYRRSGLGKRIVESLARSLKQKGMEWIVCIGAPGTEAFYAKTDAQPMTGFFPLRFYEGE